MADSMLATPDRVAVALEDGFVCGYVSPRHDDLTVHPDYRRRGHGRRLIEAGLEIAAVQGWDELRLCVPAQPGPEAFARAVGMTYHSSMWRLRLASRTAVPGADFGDDVVARPFGEWLPLDRYVDLLNEVFAEHPGHVSWTPAQIERTHTSPDFDPTSVLLLCPIDRPDEPFAFARVSLMPGEDVQAETGAVNGDVGVIGVRSAWRGRGLGRELLRWSVSYLRSHGAGNVELSVEAENELALGLYRRTGFEPVAEWPHWVKPVGSRAGGASGQP